MHYFRKNYNTEISIEEYSESRGLSNCWFIQCFKEITGSSPLQYILKLRISNAQNLLENTDYTITEIANMVGYTNSLYFSRLFHKYIGMSPKEYRKVKLKENLRE
jgi:AraC-like DNA-binding protein